MDTLNCFYFSLVGAGVVYAVFVLITGGMHDVASGLHLPFDFGGGGHVADFGGHDVGGHGELGGFPALTPVTVAGFVTAFGAFGIIAREGFAADSNASVFWAAMGGIVVAVIAHFAFGYFLIAPQGSTDVRRQDIIGATGEVITPIPAEGMGEVAFVAQGGRIVYPARSADGTAIARRTPVTIVELVGTVTVVRPRGSTPA